MSNEQQEQRPAPRFKIGQVVVVVSVKKQPMFRIGNHIWHEGEWNYEFQRKQFAAEHMLRPLSSEEIGGDEVARLSEMLLGAGSRRADMMRQRDEARALCGKLLQSFRECAGNLNFARAVMDAKSRKLAGELIADYRALIAEAESVLGKEGA